MPKRSAGTGKTARGAFYNHSMMLFFPSSGFLMGDFYKTHMLCYRAGTLQRVPALYLFLIHLRRAAGIFCNSIQKGGR